MIPLTLKDRIISVNVINIHRLHNGCVDKIIIYNHSLSFKFTFNPFILNIL